jgi:uncharacterized protein (TIGR00251 family)
MAEGVRVEVKVTPRAGATRIGGLADDADGAKMLKVSVTAAPEDGKANRAVIELLASEWRLPKSAFAVASGAGARRKSVVIVGDADVLLSRLGAWIESRGA